MEKLLAVLLALAVHVGLPAIVGLAVVGGVIITARIKRQAPELVCATDSDCAPGYICVGGKCMLRWADE